jgi:stringent starvation protein B
MESPPRRLPLKKDVLVSLLGSTSVRVFLDPRKQGVVVPSSFTRQAELVLRIGYKLSPKIPDLSMTDAGVSCTLHFNGIPHACTMPFEAIYAVIGDEDGRGVVWPDDVPVESQLLSSPKRRQPKLAAVDAGAERRAEAPRRTHRSKQGRAGGVAAEPDSGARGERPKRALPPYLRIVK